MSLLMAIRMIVSFRWRGKRWSFEGEFESLLGFSRGDRVELIRISLITREIQCFQRISLVDRLLCCC
jgi:hypothetical protein